MTLPFLRTVVTVAISRVSSPTRTRRLSHWFQPPMSGIAWIVGAGFRSGHTAGLGPPAAHAADAGAAWAAHAEAGRLVASASAAPASRSPQPAVAVQPVLRVADALMM